ncbi:hypothetical protein IFM89_004941 [Coptis chinensis]|uniref:Uncharacterized protein n=1 Tax=Coptis chinensis TaxID=261450 RepID=A0A835HNQ8_9MAGN|nr:hypothetical protein IFM89_004941 [Coptis chinensis]
MGETKVEKNEASAEMENKVDNHAKKEEETSKEKKKKKDKVVEGEEDKEGGGKKEKKKKNPEDKNDPGKLKLKLEKLDAKMQALAIKKDEILNLIKEAEKNVTSGANLEALLGTIPNITSLINKTIDELESEMDHLGVPIALDVGIHRDAKVGVRALTRTIDLEVTRHATIGGMLMPREARWRKLIKSSPISF